MTQILQRELVMYKYKMVLVKEKLRTVSRENLEVFLHLIRIVNALRSMMKIQVKLAQTEDEVEQYKDRMDILFVNIGLFYEGVKKYLSSLHPRIPRSYISDADLEALDILKQRLSDPNDDDFLRVAAIIRDKVAFHFDLDVVSHNVSNGEPEADMLIGYVKSRAIRDCVFLEPYTSIFMYLADNCPKNIDPAKRIDWIADTATEEIHAFCKILERICNGFFKENGRLVPAR